MKYLNLECENVGLEWKLQFRYICILQERQSLTRITFQISFVLHLDEAIHILCNPLPQSVWIKQLPSYTIGCKTQIVLIFKNSFKAASLSWCTIVTVKVLELLHKQPPYLIKIFLKVHNHLNKLLLCVERTKKMYLLWRKCAI